MSDRLAEPEPVAPVGSYVEVEQSTEPDAAPVQASLDAVLLAGVRRAVFAAELATIKGNHDAAIDDALRARELLDQAIDAHRRRDFVRKLTDAGGVV